MKGEKLFLAIWVALWIALAVVVVVWLEQTVSAECYVATLTENVIAPSIPGYYQVVPVIVGQAVSCY